jgi:hypothetical protein
MASDPVRGLHGEVVHKVGVRVIRGGYPPGSLIDPEGLEGEPAAEVRRMPLTMEEWREADQPQRGNRARRLPPEF